MGVKPKSRQALADEVEREWYSSPRPSAYVSPSERERLAATLKDLIQVLDHVVNEIDHLP